MTRKLDNWLESYIDYTYETEPARIFHKWVGLSVLSSALRKQVWLNLGRIRVFANLYIVLVAEPGIARKSQSITFGSELISELTDIQVSADCITKEALLQDLEKAATTFYIAGEDKWHCSLNIISKEFESFLGQKAENRKMIVLLTDLYDSPEAFWKYRTKQSGDSNLQNVFLNLLGATTPDSIASSLPAAAIGGGLTSRMIFIWAANKAGKHPYPAMTPRILKLRQDLISDLSVISRTVGQYVFSEELKQKWYDWYMDYDEQGRDRICKDPAFNGWYARKPMILLKMAMLLTASKGDQMIMEWNEVERAERMLHEAELRMGRTFSAVGRSDVAPDIDMIKNIVKQYGVINEKQLLQIVWRDVDARKFDNVMQTIMRGGEVVRRYQGPKGQVGVWYYWASKLRQSQEQSKKQKSTPSPQ